jgi:PAS domain S-box-containing protein
MKHLKHKQYSLVTRVYFHLIGVAAASIILFTIIWTEEEVDNYRDDVALLRKSYFEEKNLEIKNKILEIKNYLSWIVHYPLQPLEETMKNELQRLDDIDLSVTPGTGKDANTIFHEVRDSAGVMIVPVYVLDQEGNIVFSSIPFSDENENSIEILRKVKEYNASRGTVTFYNIQHPLDSTLSAVAYFDSELIPGFKVVSLLDSEHFETVLKAYILDSLSRLRYAAEEYVFVNDIYGKSLIRSGKLNNPPIDILESGNDNWINIFKVQQTAASHPEGVYLTYDFPKLATSNIDSKTSYFNYFPRWKWIIGTGYYDDEFNDILKEKKKVLITRLRHNLLFVSIYLLFSVFSCYILVLFFSKRLRKHLDAFREFFDRAGSGQFRIDNSSVKYLEFAHLAEEANKMAQKRDLAEKELSENKAKLDAALASMSEAVFISDTNGNFIDFNEAFAKFHRFKGKEECARTFQEYPAMMDVFYLNGELRPLDQWAVPRALRGESGTNTEFILKRKDTGETWIGSYNFAPIRNDHGLIVGAVVTARDVTEQKANEKEIMKLNEELEVRVALRTAQLENANKELESFSYSISHDLRSPLRAINGFSQILSKRYYDSLSDEGRKYMGYIIEASNRMDRLINDLLKYSRLGRVSVNMSIVSLQKILEHIRNDFIPQLEEIGGNLLIDKDLPDVMGDDSLFSQVFINLIENAITYRKADIPPEIRISCTTKNKSHILKISDNGIGIPREHWEKIFDVFHRLHNEDTYPGTGIGLATVKKAVTMLGGTVWVESSEGAGSDFFIKLPVNPKFLS